LTNYLSTSIINKKPKIKMWIQEHR